MSSSEQSQDKSKGQMNTKVKNNNRFHKGQSFNKSSTDFQSRSLIEPISLSGRYPHGDLSITTNDQELVSI